MDEKPKKKRGAPPIRQGKITRQKTARLKVAVLNQLEKGDTFADACRAVQCCPRNFANWRARDAVFAYECEVALAAGAAPLQVEAVSRATIGVKRYKFTSRGVPVMWWNPQTGDYEHYAEYEKSDRLLEFMLSSRDPERFDAAVRREAQKQIGDAYRKALDNSEGDEDAAALAAVRALLAQIEAKKSAQ